MSDPHPTYVLTSLNTAGDLSFPKDFDCGTRFFNDYINKGSLKKALKAENLHATGIFVDGCFAGFLTLTIGVLDRARVPVSLKASNQPPQLPITKILMIAVDQRFQNGGLGSILMAEALKRSFTIHGTVPLKGIYLDAGPGKVSYYTQFGFDALENEAIDSTTPMYMPMSNVIASMIEAAQAS